jgi:hypothetical protein
MSNAHRSDRIFMQAYDPVRMERIERILHGARDLAPLLRR